MKTGFSVIIFFGLSALAAPPAAPPLPSCPRPLDMSLPGEVLKYDQCLKKKRLFCEKNEKLKECISFKISEKPKTVSSTVSADALPSERCSIQRDGSYKCKQDVLRFITKEIPRNAPQASPASSAPTAATPAQSPENEGEPVPPPVPPPADLPK